MAKSLFLNPGDDNKDDDDDPDVLKLEDPEEQPIPPEEGDVFVKSKSNRSNGTPKKD